MKYFSVKNAKVSYNIFLGRISLSLLVILATVSSLSSCKKARMCCTIPPNLEVYISVQNPESKDLLNPLTKGAYAHDAIEVYYLHGQKKELAFAGNLDHPKFWDFIRDSISGRYFLNVRTSSYQNKANKSTTFVDWNNQDEDTITCLFDGEKHEPIQKIWCNGRLVWDGYKPDDTIRTIFTFKAKRFTLIK